MIHKKIYLAGGMGSLTFEEQNTWRVVISKMLNDIVDGTVYKLEIVSPPNYYNFERCTYDSEEEVRRFDIREVGSSDMIIVNFNDKKSIGTAMELQHAFDKGITILGINTPNYNKGSSSPAMLHPWLKGVCDKIFNDYSSLVNYVAEYYFDKRRFENI